MTKIEWADETINPLIGCGRQCPYCYASRMATRLAGMPHTAERYAGIARGGRWTGEIRWVPSELEKLDRWRKPRRVFIGSMGDLCYATAGQLAAILDAVWLNRQHTCMILTKDPRRLGGLIDVVSGACNRSPPPNLLIGASITTQGDACLRLPELVTIPARLFVSAEPLHGGIDLTEWIDRVSWVIAGAETGHRARPAQLDWFRSLRDQCAAAGVPFFFKKDSDGSRELDGVRHEEIPQ